MRKKAVELEIVSIVQSVAEDAADGDVLDGLAFGDIFELKPFTVQNVLKNAF